MRIAIVAGEVSGDLLGGSLMRALKQRYPDARFEGIGGPQMLAEGLDSLYPLETLSVMGLVEVLAHLPRLLQVRRELTQRFRADPPDVFIGVDAPDFNLGLEERLRKAGIKTVHYVSPTVWAWRQGRIRQIKRAVDLMLSIFPFETEFYRRHGVEVEFVGHPTAFRFPLEHDRDAARCALGLADSAAPVVALLPGSRGSEVGRLGPVVAATVAELAPRYPDCRFVTPVATAGVRETYSLALAKAGVADRVQLLDGQAELAMGAADVVVAASGTATVEAMLLKRPTVVIYKVAPLSYWLFRYLIKVDHIAMANLLAGEELMPEFIQDAATGPRVAAAVAKLLDDPEAAGAQRQRWLEIHRQLRASDEHRAAAAIAALIEG